MAVQAYFLIDVADEVAKDGLFKKALSELQDIPEVAAVDPVSGRYDLVVTVEAPIRLIFAANKILAKEWVKHLEVLKVVPPEEFSKEKAVPTLGASVDMLS